MKVQSLLSVAVLFAGGCLDEAVDEAEYSEVEQEIEMGSNDWSTPTRNAVVLIGGFCTGTLVAPNLVLTAAHCGWSDHSYATGGWTSIPPVTIYFGPDRSAPIATRVANQVSVPPLATAGPWLVDDIALLRLTTTVPASLAVPRPTYVDRPATLSSSSTIYQVGYGGGRDRRYMTGSNYKDWLLPDERLMNGFVYTATYRGDGVGDRGTNIEGGDSGGPMLLNSSTGFVMGDLSHWDPYGIATFGPGGEGRPSIRNWILQYAPQKGDLDVISIWASGCTGTGGDPTVTVRVKNRGARITGGWVDVFHDRTTAPSVGDYSTIYRHTSSLAPDQTKDMSFAISAPPGSHRIDVVLDTTRAADELDETNNTGTATVTLPDCSFN